MKLGAQLYSLRTFTQTPEELKAAILKCREMGYQNVQFSGVAQMGAEVWAQISKETGMEIVCTHSAFDRIVNDTEALIKAVTHIKGNNLFTKEACIKRASVYSKEDKFKEYTEIYFKGE